MPPRKRTIQNNVKSKEAKPAPVSPEEAQLAAAQENQEYMGAQLGYLQGRVAQLRVELNRANKEIERLTAKAAD